MTKNETTCKTEFIEKVDGEEVVIESVGNLSGSSYGGFFPYINLIKGLDLIRYQIFDTINKNNYQDNCFVYACFQSGVFNDDELYKLCSIMLTLTIPNNEMISLYTNSMIREIHDIRNNLVLLLVRIQKS